MSAVVLITGTSTGFGRLAAEVLAKRGYTVFATMRDPDGRNASSSRALQEQAGREGWNLHVLDLDVISETSVNLAVEKAIGMAGRIDVVINNAGFGALGLTEAFTVEQFQRVFDVNLYGAVRVNRAVLPSMRRQRSGLLIHVSSGAGRYAIPCMAAYSGSKFALEALADAYRFELAPFGIDSVLVEPGIHRTPILGKHDACGRPGACGRLWRGGRHREPCAGPLRQRQPLARNTRPGTGGGGFRHLDRNAVRTAASPHGADASHQGRVGAI